MKQCPPYFSPLMAGTLALATALTGCVPNGTNVAPAAPPLPKVTVVAPANSLVQDTLEYTGRILPSQRVEVRSRVSGHLRTIAFRDGELVRAGEPMFVIDQRPYAAARDRALGSLGQATARRKLAEAQLARASALGQSGASSAEDLERARSEFESAQAALSLSKAELRSAELDLSFTTVTAPISGRVSERRVDVGNYVTGADAQGAMLTTIVAQNPVYIAVDLTEGDLARLHRQKKFPDQLQLLSGSLSEGRSAKIDFIDNEINTRSGTVRMRASIDNADQMLTPGGFVRLQIPVGPPQPRLLVPDSAIQSDQAKKLVFIVAPNGKVAAKQVELGTVIGSMQVVVSGLAHGDRVIVAGAQRVRPGDRVKIAEPRAGA